MIKFGLNGVAALAGRVSCALPFSMAAVFVSCSAFAADVPTKFSNTDTIANTRHNMTQRAGSGAQIGTLNSSAMDPVRNDYREICVYCHTPHGANANISVPLWNRTVKATTYTTYNQLGTGTLTQVVSQPGANSLACLSCHDGQTAIDSIINMPGSGKYSAGQATAVDVGFLNSWGQNSQAGGAPPASHANLTECMACHTDAVSTLLGATEFKSFNLGTDLRDDHPVGVVFPSGAADFFQPAGVNDRAIYFDNNTNGRMDKSEIRLYKTGSNFQVECASCHDPHGVPSLGGTFNKTFLRVSNENSGVCLTCHNK